MTRKSQLAAQAQQKPRPRSKSKPKKESDNGRQDSQATKLVELAEDAGVELFHTPGSDADGYALVAFDGHRETWRIGTKAFRFWLKRLYWTANKAAANSQAMQDAIGVLRGKALFDGAEYPVFVRLAEFDGAIWLDLADDDWRAVRIGQDSWEVVSNPPVRFVRPRGMSALPVPERGGNVDELRRFININDDADWLLLLAWLLAALRPNGPFPVLGIHGEQGSAKSTACRMLRGLVDPNEADLRSGPRNEQDLVIAATNGWIVALENLSKIPDWLSDALCRLATGGGFGTRELYTDGEEKLFSAKRPMMLNGITELATRPDLLDRSILISLPRIPDDKRRSEAGLWREFDTAKPRILGALMDTVSAGLANINHVVLDCEPRMADFAEWGVAVEPALDCEPGAFLAAYMRNRETANESAIESSVIAEPLLLFLDNRNEWQGTATELKMELEDIADQRVVKQKGWPKLPHFLSGEMRRIAPNLRRIGYDVEFNKSGSRRLIHITRTTPQTSDQSVPSDPCSGNGRPRASHKRPSASSSATENTEENPGLDAVDAKDADLHDCSDDRLDWINEAFP
ncbi:hypothetical protein Mal52_27280 [Symmachiella dynata]|uniref:ATP-binding protein n=1 Tax=Symmachiella dynata TaxID=2527995 RepID=A0A517ZPB1_9PLAN|nr:hypothetical protein [Symmachiella dynata]QDU44250.1 hypothetical protein Mal52_27280 [Symmachiella dynata]